MADEQPAEGRGEHDGQALEDRLDGEAHGPPLGRETLRDDGEGRGEGQARPRHGTGEPHKDEWPARAHEIEAVAHECQAIEGDQRPLTSPPIRQYPTWVRVEAF